MSMAYNAQKFVQALKAIQKFLSLLPYLHNFALSGILMRALFPFLSYPMYLMAARTCLQLSLVIRTVIKLVDITFIFIYVFILADRI